MGIISVSVDCNEVGSRSGDTLKDKQKQIKNRAAVVLGAIKYFQDLKYDFGRSGIQTLGGHIDFSSVGLMGHSRGGEAMLLVSQLLAIAKTGISNVKVRGILAIAPTNSCLSCLEITDFCPTENDYKIKMPPAPAPAFMTILPAADLDIKCSDGARFYDQASADPFKCQLYVHKANHTNFNTEWVNDDILIEDDKLKLIRSESIMLRDDQEEILKAYGCAFFRTVLHPTSLHMRKFLEGLEIPPSVKCYKDVHISFERADSSKTVDDFEGHGIRKNSLGKTNSWAGGLTPTLEKFDQKTYRSFFGNTCVMLARSKYKSGRFKWSLGQRMDLRGKEIRIRAAEVYIGGGVPECSTGFKLGLADAQKNRGFVDSDEVGGLPRPYDRSKVDIKIFEEDFTKTMFKTLRFPVSCIAERGVNVTQIEAIVLHMDRNDGRELAFDQLQIVG